MENNLDEIAVQIFNRPPKPAGTIVLELEHNVPAGSSVPMVSQVVSDILMQFLLKGIVVLYGADMKPELLSEEQIDSVRAYFHSMGYYMNYKTDAITEPPAVSAIARNDLQDFSERFYNFDTQTWHEFSFTKLRVHFGVKQ